jgi:hypothetical protein
MRDATPESLLVSMLITLPLLLAGLYYLRKSKLTHPPAAVGNTKSKQAR